jgi:branched-chain amino acid transport system permease protein
MIDIMSFLTTLGTYIGIYLILSLTLTLETSSGITNFGKTAFYGLGAYVGAVIGTYLPLAMYGGGLSPFDVNGIQMLLDAGRSNPIMDIGVFALSVIVGFGVVAALGLALTYPIHRVGSALVGFTLLSLGEVLRLIYLNTSALGESKGFMGIPSPFAWVKDPKLAGLLYLLVVLAFAGITLLTVSRILNSPLGRILRGIRDDELVALYAGWPTVLMKARILALSSGLTGVAGVLWAYYFTSINPNMFTPSLTFNIWAMIIIGGLGSIAGGIVGTVLLASVDYAMRFVVPYIGVAFITPDYLRWIVVGLLMIIVLIKKPEGLIPEKPVVVTLGEYGGGDSK